MSRLLSFLLGGLLLLSLRLLSAAPDLFRAFSALDNSFLTSGDLSLILLISLTGEGEESRSLCGFSYLSRSSESEDLGLSGFFLLFLVSFLPLGLGLFSSDLILCRLQSSPLSLLPLLVSCFEESLFSLSLLFGGGEGESCLPPLRSAEGDLLLDPSSRLRLSCDGDLLTSLCGYSLLLTGDGDFLLSSLSRERLRCVSGELEDLLSLPRDLSSL